MMPRHCVSAVLPVLMLASQFAIAQAPNAEPLEKPQAALTGQTKKESYSCLEVLKKSMFGKQSDPWTPLPLTDFADGWCDPWIAPPNPSGGSLRQGWVNTYDAFFNRMVVGIASYARGTATTRDEYTGTLLYETPITRRYLFGVFVPYVDNLQNGAVPQATGFGNVVLENRFILEETQDFTLSFNLNGRVPTGSPQLGDNRTSINPYLSFFQDIGNGFSIRGTAGIDIPLDSRPDGISSTLIGQLGIGQTLTPHDVPLFGDFTYYVTANFRESFGVENTFSVSRQASARTWGITSGSSVGLNFP